MRLSYLFLLIGVISVVVGISNLPNLPQWEDLPTIVRELRIVRIPILVGAASLLFGIGWWVFVDRKH